MIQTLKMLMSEAKHFATIRMKNAIATVACYPNVVIASAIVAVVGIAYFTF